MNFAITRNRTFISTGFDTCAFMPASSVFCLSSSKAFAVMATIGTAALESPNLFRLLCFPYLYVLWKILQKYVEDSLHSSQFQYLQLQSYMQFSLSNGISLISMVILPPAGVYFSEFPLSIRAVSST